MAIEKIPTSWKKEKKQGDFFQSLYRLIFFFKETAVLNKPNKRIFSLFENSSTNARQTQNTKIA